MTTKRRIAVLTDLDMAETLLAQGDKVRANLYASVALVNAEQEFVRGDDEWDRILKRARAVKGKIDREG